MHAYRKDTVNRGPLNGGKVAALTARLTQSPVGVPANLPFAAAFTTLPLLAMVTQTLVQPGT